MSASQLLDLSRALQPGGGPVLRDIHQPSAPPLWPPAPGWWLLALALLLIALGVWFWRRRRTLRRARIQAVFDHTVNAAGSDSARVQAMSELLRRASRRSHPDADTLDGEEWLRLLDEGMSPPVFVAGPGRLLLDGGFRPELDAKDVAELERVARVRFLQWMGAK